MNRTILLLLTGGAVFAQTPKITTPKESLGFNLGDDYHMASYSQLDKYWHKIASECDRCKLVDIGPTEEGRRQYMMIITSPENMKKLDHYKDISARLAHAEGLTDESGARAGARGQSCRVDRRRAACERDGGVAAGNGDGVPDGQPHRSGDDAVAERRDRALYTLANPDGQELVAQLVHAREGSVEAQRNGLPRLYAKYVGHDDNRDFYMSNMKETTNMNHQLFLEWFPQIMYNHHQTGPAGAVIFMPPFRDPFNYNFDPLIPLGIRDGGDGDALAAGGGGQGRVGMRTGANYSTWWNGGLRTRHLFSQHDWDFDGNYRRSDADAIPLVAG